MMQIQWRQQDDYVFQRNYCLSDQRPTMQIDEGSRGLSKELHIICHQGTTIATAINGVRGLFHCLVERDLTT